MNKKILMSHRVKEFFNSFYRKNREEQLKINRFNKMKRNRRRLGAFPHQYFEISPISEFSHFIDCEVSPAICPMQWEDLEVDMNSINQRYCKYCDKFVYKVDNEFMLQKMQDENKCMAISNHLIEKINGKQDNNDKNLMDRLSINKLILVYKYYNQEQFKNFIDNNLTQEEVLKSIVLDILSSQDIESIMKIYIIDSKIDLGSVLNLILSNIKDIDFQNKVSEKLWEIIER